MRFPYVINENTKDVYTPSVETLNLLRECGREIFAENLAWGDKDLPELVTLCVLTISKNFEAFPIIHDLHGAERDVLLEILPTDLPLEIVVPLIDDEIYWKRRYHDRFGNVKERLRSDWTWKSIFLERYVRDCVEKAQPQYNDELDMVEILKLCSPYVKRLQITELKAWEPPLTLQPAEIPEVFPIKHVNFIPILSNLANIEELDIVYGMNNVTETFKWDMFKVSVDDCKYLGQGILTLNYLTVLKLHRSNIEYFHAQALLHSIIVNESLIELDLSHCYLGDNGALCIAKVIMTHPRLETINLCNNNIRKIGAEGIGFALLQDSCCPLISLNLRLNPLQHDGVMGLLRSIIRGTKPKQLNIACCHFGDDTPLRLAQTLRLNASLETLDVSNNWFGEEGGKTLLECIKDNIVLKHLELGETDIPPNCLHAIQKILKRNCYGEDDRLSGRSTEEETELGEGETETEIDYSEPQTENAADEE